MNVIEKLHDYKNKLVQQQIERDKKLREERLDKANKLFADFHNGLPEEVRDLFVFGKVWSNDNLANVIVTVGDIKFQLDYCYDREIYMAQFDDIPRDEAYWYAWDSKQPFEKLIDCILFASSNKKQLTVNHNVIVGRTATFI